MRKVVTRRADGSSETTFMPDSPPEGTPDWTDKIRSAIASDGNIHLPAGRFRVTETIFLSGGARVSGEGRERTIIEFDILGASGDGFSWVIGDGSTRGREGGLSDLTVTAACDSVSQSGQHINPHVRDLVSLNNWAIFAIENCNICAPGRYGVFLQGCQNIVIRNCNINNYGGGAACLRVASDVVLSTALQFDNVYFRNSAGHGVDLTGDAQFYGTCVFESNGIATAYNVHGAKSPRLGNGLLVRQGIATVIGGHFENNAGHACYIGSELASFVTLVNPNIGSGAYTQPTAAGIFLDILNGGALTGGAIYMPRTLVIHEVETEGKFTAVGFSIRGAAPEYVSAVDLNRTDISFYPGLISYRNVDTRENVTIAGGCSLRGIGARLQTLESAVLH